MSRCLELVKGDPVYGETAMDIVMKKPEERFREVDCWIDVLAKQIDEFADNKDELSFVTGEAWRHAKVALYATEEMGSRTAQKWDRETFWVDWLEKILTTNK